jgi:RNA polymerase sigma factor (sigma-70 family)
MDTMQADAQQARRILAGDRTVTAGFVDAHYPRIYAFLRRLAGSDADAADLTQTTFSRAWLALERYRGQSTLNTWLHGIAHHVWQDWLRRDHHETAVPDEWWEDCPDTAALPDERASLADLRREVYAAVDRLPDELRATVHLHHYQGLTLDETAAALAIATSTVKHRLRTALARLQRALADPTLHPLTQ